MNCWSHGPRNVGAHANCAGCGAAVTGGVVICEKCSHRLNQCQTCRQVPVWDIDQVIRDLQQWLKDTREQYATHANRGDIDLARILTKEIEIYENVITRLQEGEFSNSAQVRVALQHL